MDIKCIGTNRDANREKISSHGFNMKSFIWLDWIETGILKTDKSGCEVDHPSYWTGEDPTAHPGPTASQKGAGSRAWPPVSLLGAICEWPGGWDAWD